MGVLWHCHDQSHQSTQREVPSFATAIGQGHQSYLQSVGNNRGLS